MKTQTRSITLIGAGLVGSLLAIYLARRGYRVQLFEKRPDMRHAAISAGRSINLALANRGIRPLEELGLMDAVSSQIIPMKGRMLHTENGQLTFLPYGQRPHEVIYSVSRGELNKLLMSAAEDTGKVRIEFEQSIESIDYVNKALRLRNEKDGSEKTFPFDLLIGADGGGSPVRKATDAFYGVNSEEERLFHSYKELHIPAGAGGQFQIEKEALHIWPRGDYMMIALPNPDGSFTVTMFLPDQGENSFASLTSSSAFEHFFSQRFTDAQALLPDAAGLFMRNPTGFLGTVHCPHWVVPGHSLLIGDAAHAITPFHGQGMNCGFEDCHDLNRLLDEHDDDWDAVMPAYQAVRQPNAEAIALMAKENYVEMRSTSADPKFQLKKAVGFLLEKHFPQFIPRYSMVMFHHLPYSEALRLGHIQEQILSMLCQEIENADQVDLVRAGRVIAEQLH